MTDRELMQQAADKLSIMVGYPGLRLYHEDIQAVMNALRERLAQPAPTIDKSAARRIATALGWVPPSDTSQERVDEEAKQRREQIAKEYERGYADTMNWKLQNHLEHLPSGLEAAVKAEREACAKVCEDIDHNGVMIAADCAAAIRARGN